MTSVRPATVTDLPVLHAMILELAEYEKIAHEVTATPEDTARELFGPRPSAEGLIAERAGTPAGFAVFYAVYSTFAGRPALYLEDLYVREEHRRQGVGRALITAFIDAAKARACPKVEWRVLRWNQPALDFYRSLEAEILDDWVPVRRWL